MKNLFRIGISLCTVFMVSVGTLCSVAVANTYTALPQESVVKEQEVNLDFTQFDNTYVQGRHIYDLLDKVDGLSFAVLVRYTGGGCSCSCCGIEPITELSNTYACEIDGAIYENLNMVLDGTEEVNPNTMYYDGTELMSYDVEQSESLCIDSSFCITESGKFLQNTVSDCIIPIYDTYESKLIYDTDGILIGVLLS